LGPMSHRQMIETLYKASSRRLSNRLCDTFRHSSSFSPSIPTAAFTLAPITISVTNKLVAPVSRKMSAIEATPAPAAYPVSSMTNVDNIIKQQQQNMRMMHNHSCHNFEDTSSQFNLSHQ